MLSSVPSFRIDTEGNLVPPEGCENIFDGLKLLTTHAISRPADNEACVAIAEYDHLVLGLPPENGKIELRGDALCLTLLWATVEETGKNALVCFDTWDVTNDPKDAWMIVSEIEWTTMPMFGQLLRRFTTPTQARQDIVHGNKSGMILKTELLEGTGNIVDVHGPTVRKDKGVLRLTDERLLEAIFVPQAGNPGINIGQMMRKNRRKPLRLQRTFPDLDYAAYKEALGGWGDPAIMLIRLVHGGGARIIATATREDKCFVRIVIFRLTREERQRVFP